MTEPIEVLFELQELEVALDESRATSTAGAPKAEAELSGRIAECRDKIPAQVVAIYDRVKKRFPIPIVSLHDGKCTGCFLAVPRGAILESQRNHTLLSCPHCGRILKTI